METHTHSDTDATVAAMAVLDRHFAALNAGDAAALADTLHFPHYRLAGVRMQVWEGPHNYLRDFRARAGVTWHHSAWNFRDVFAASADKVHVDVQFTRYCADSVIAQRSQQFTGRDGATAITRQARRSGRGRCCS